jgi:MscS family membrane protein
MDFADILTKEYYGNTVQGWFVALAIVVAAAIAGKILYWFTQKVLRRLTEKTQTRFDDILIDMLEEPLVLAATLAGVWWGLQTLNLTETAEVWLGRIAQGLIVLAVAWLIARLLDALYAEYLAPLAEQSETDLDDQVLPILRKGTKLAVWSVGIIVALNNAGYQVGAILAGLGIGGLALAMAAQDTVSNIFGGFTIFADRPFTLNDRIRLDGYDGTVTEVGLRSTRLQTLAGPVVTIPNSKFSDSAVENVTAEPNRKVVVTLGLTYDTPAEKMEEAMETLRQIAAGQPGLDEKVLVAFNELGDFSMNLLFIYYIQKDADILQTQTDINLAVLREFNHRGLELAFPTQTIYAQTVS